MQWISSRSPLQVSSSRVSMTPASSSDPPTGGPSSMAHSAAAKRSLCESATSPPGPSSNDRPTIDASCASHDSSRTSDGESRHRVPSLRTSKNSAPACPQACPPACPPVALRRPSSSTGERLLGDGVAAAAYPLARGLAAVKEGKARASVLMASCFSEPASRPSAADTALPGPLASGEARSLRRTASQSSPSKKGWPRTSQAPASPLPSRLAASTTRSFSSRSRACAPTNSGMS
mmetsp:Transcript_51206/g.134638  ORF Transcript_51206/g.134638 Transcript_51206/m.134638 type:complete len:234 (+) Transcript_51206:886-1587(+)|eukprot:3597876-Prymnesium_polylepis.2